MDFKKLLRTIDNVQGDYRKILKEGASVNINADNADEVMKLINMMKGSGIPDAAPVGAVGPHPIALGSVKSPENGMSEVIPEIDDEEDWDNEPDVTTQDNDYMQHDLAGGINDAKRSYRSAEDGDNPMNAEEYGMRESVREYLYRMLSEKMKKDCDCGDCPDCNAVNELSTQKLKAYQQKAHQQYDDSGVGQLSTNDPRWLANKQAQRRAKGLDMSYEKTRRAKAKQATEGNTDHTGMEISEISKKKATSYLKKGADSYKNTDSEDTKKKRTKGAIQAASKVAGGAKVKATEGNNRVGTGKDTHPPDQLKGKTGASPSKFGKPEQKNVSKGKLTDSFIEHEHGDDAPGEYDTFPAKPTSYMSQFKRKPVQGLYNYDHFEAPDGAFIQVYANYGSKNFEAIFQDEDGNRKKFYDFQELRNYVNSNEPGTAVSKNSIPTSESYRVTAKTKDGETFQSGIFKTKKEANDKHWKMSQSKNYTSIKTVPVKESKQLSESKEVNDIIKLATMDIASTKTPAQRHVETNNLRKLAGL